MKYNNLHELLMHSSSSRRYFINLPVTMQLALHKHNNFIHSAHELHMRIDAINAQQRALALSGNIENNL